MIGCILVVVALSITIALVVRYAETDSVSDENMRALMIFFVCGLVGTVGWYAGDISWQEYPTGQPVEVAAVFQRGTEMKVVLKWGKNIAVVSQKELMASEVRAGATYIFTGNGWYKIQD